MEPAEIPEFTEQMKAAGERHMMRVSLIISVLAAMVATVAVLGHREHTETILKQADKDNQWQQYESHTMRILQEQTEVKMLTLQPSKEGADVQSAINDDQARIAKWQKSEADEMKTAKELTDEVRVAESKAGRFDLAEALLEIAVVLASITLLTKHHRYAVVGSLLGLTGIAITVSTFLLR
jgi:lipid II:glycine glycyltransferase (peptidoglycan interpeptide bridge formation enzyme)